MSKPRQQQLLIQVTVLAALSVGSILASYYFGPRTRHTPDITGWAIPILAAGIVFAVFAIIRLSDFYDSTRFGEPSRRKRQLERDLKHVQSALKTIELVKSELESGRRLSEQLEEQIKTQQELLSLSREQTEGVRDLVAGVVSGSNRRSLWVSVVLAVLLVFIGWILPKPSFLPWNHTAPAPIVSVSPHGTR